MPEGYDSPTAYQLIRDERAAQMLREGYTNDHDNTHRDGQLYRAALAYLGNDPHMWPWAKEGFKSTTYLRNLIKAGALVQAEIDRLVRVGGITESWIATGHQLLRTEITRMAQREIEGNREWLR